MKRIQHWHRARLLGHSGPRLKLLAALLILSLLTSWLGAPPAAFASGKLKSCQDVCSPDSNPPDFTLDVAPASQTVEQGEAATYTATISIINCYSETITLSLAGLPGGATYNFAPATMSSFGDSVLTVSTAQDTPAGDYALTVNADSGSLQHQASISLTVNANPGSDPYFTLEVSPASQSVEVSAGADYVVGVEGHNGFGEGTLNLPVALAVSGLPSGATATFSPDNLATASEDRTLSVSTAADTPPGDYTLTVSGDSGDLHHQVNVNLTVIPQLNPSFSIAPTPSSQTTEAGNSTSYAVALEALDGFSATVSLSVSGLPAGALASFDPAALTPPAASVLSVSAAADTPAGAYPLTISGDGGGLHHEAGATLVVVEPGSQTVVSVSSDSDSVFVGQNVESEILLSNASDFYGIEFFMSYDPAVLQVVDADPSLPGVQIDLGGLFPSDQNTVGVNEVNNTTGKISLGVSRLSPLPSVNGDGLLAVITWEAVGEGVSDLDFTHTKLASPNGNELSAISQDGTVTVGLTGELEGTVHPQGRFDHDGVEISVSPAGLQLLTDVLGWFKLLVHGDLTVTARLHGYLDAQASVQLAPGAAVDLGATTLYGGEVTGDNLIDILDLAYMGARFHGSDLSADINGDGLVDILDLVLSAANYMMTGPTDWGQ